MRMNRRNVLVGLGTIVAGGGAALGTGAFSQVDANRTVTVETAGDGQALIGLSSTSDYETGTGSGNTVKFDLTQTNLPENASGLNIDATTRIAGALTITNNSDQSVNISTSTGSSDVSANLEPASFPLDPSGTSGDTQTCTLVIDTTNAGNNTFDAKLTITATP